MPGGPRPAVVAGFLTCVVLIGLNFIAMRASNAELAPTWGAALRFGVAALLLWSFMAAAKLPVPRGRALAGAALYGALLFGAFFGFVYWGLVEVPAGVASIINATVPLLTFLMAWGLRIETFRAGALWGAVIVIGGIAALVGSPGLDGVSPARLAAVFVAAAAAAMGGVVIQWFPRSHPVATNAVGMSLAFVILLAVSAAAGEPWALPQHRPTWIAVAYLVGSSLVLFPLFVWVIGEWTASATAYAVVLAPLVTVPVAGWLLGERIGIAYAVAAALILLGAYVGVRRPS